MSGILIYQHAGSGNHGCEALARTASAMLKDLGKISLCTAHLKEDSKYGMGALPLRLVQSEAFKRKSFRWYCYQVNRQLFHSNYIYENCFFDKAALSMAEGADLAVAIGGDNYCYDQGHAFWSTDNQIRKKVKKMVLWGASLEPEELKKGLAQHLALFDLIIARESITYKALKELSLPTALCHDGAFTLPATPAVLPSAYHKENQYIAINLSPMVMAKESQKGIVQENYRELIRYIMEKTAYDIMLVPHVVWEGSDDRIPLQQLYQEYAETKKIHLVMDQSACQLKSIITGSQFFIGARTHATIAAYSAGVPTIVLGYSVKARGIAKDLLGDGENYVLPTQELQTKNDLVNKFRQLESNSEVVRKQLKDVMPDYVKCARDAAELVRCILEENCI